MCYWRKLTGDVPDIIPICELRLDENKRLIKEPEEIVDRKTKNLRRKMVDLVLVQRKHTNGPNLTWETESDMMSRYPHLFVGV